MTGHDGVPPGGGPIKDDERQLRLLEGNPTKHLFKHMNLCSLSVVLMATASHMSDD